MAANPAVIKAAKAGIAVALERQSGAVAPWLMASFNDGADPHFRKAWVEPNGCPVACPQPCIASCPPLAIAPHVPGIAIQTDLCFGCGRCEPVCPEDSIRTVGYTVSADAIAPQLVAAGIQAIEIHTRIGRAMEFARLWQQLSPWLKHLQLVSVSFNDGEGLENYLWQLVGLMQPRPRQLVWQVDGRPMSGDIGTGTTRATLQLARKVLDWHLPGYVQLAGGTNEATLPKARQLGLGIGGIAYGSYARQVVADVAEVAQLEARPRLLAEAIARARILVQQVKRHPLPVRPPIPVPAFDAVTHSSTV